MSSVCGHQLMHRLGLVAFHEIRLVAVAGEKLRQLLVGNARQHRGIGDLVAIQMQDRQHRAVARRIQKFVRVPAGRQRPGFRFAIAHHAAHQQIRIVERRAVRMRQRVTQFAAFVNRARRFRRHMARNSTWKGELLEQPLHAFFGLRNIRIDLAVGAFQIGVGHQPGPPWPGPAT